MQSPTCFFRARRWMRFWRVIPRLLERRLNWPPCTSGHSLEGDVRLRARGPGAGRAALPIPAFRADEIPDRRVSSHVADYDRARRRLHLRSRELPRARWLQGLATHA